MMFLITERDSFPTLIDNVFTRPILVNSIHFLLILKQLTFLDFTPAEKTDN